MIKLKNIKYQKEAIKIKVFSQHQVLVFSLRSSFRSLMIQGFVTGEAPHCSGGYGVVHTEVNTVSHTLSHGIDVISMRLTEFIPVCNLKTPPQSFFSFLTTIQERGERIVGRSLVSGQNLLSYILRYEWFDDSHHTGLAD